MLQRNGRGHGALVHGVSAHASGRLLADQGGRNEHREDPRAKASHGAARAMAMPRPRRAPRVYVAKEMLLLRSDRHRGGTTAMLRQ